MEYLPIFININSQSCLVVGGGNVAFRKILLLLKAGANVECIAIDFCDALIDKAQSNNIILTKKEFDKDDILGRALIVSATNNKKLNAKVSILSKARNIPVNVVDSPKLCSFIMPSIVDRAPLIIAISSSGKAPVLSRIIRAKLESSIPNSYGRLAQLVGEFRDNVKNKFSNIKDRRYFWESVLSGVIAEKVFVNKVAEAKIMIQQQLDNIIVNSIGEVYLVGGGPGDPDLLTFKALRLMQQADVVLYDRLVSDEVMELVRRDAELIYVGKEKGNHAVPQGGINKLLVRLAKQGKRVCRLKGGDPFIFGRGGEEIAELADNNIPFQVVPGITAASGCAAYSGIPLTHRDYSQSCRFVTAHLKNNTIDLPWDELVVEQQTIVFYMGLIGAKYISAKLIEHGLRKNIPIAIIEKGTTKNHKVYTTTLEGVPDLLDNNNISAPTIIIVGEVVSLRKKLNWFE